MEYPGTGLSGVYLPLGIKGKDGFFIFEIKVKREYNLYHVKTGEGIKK